MDFSLEIVDPACTFSLRRDVLRPYLSVEQVAERDLPATTFVALAPDGAVLSCASLLDDPPPLAVPEAVRGRRPTSRIRYMATREDLRGQGVGRAVLDRLIEEVARRGGGLLWCNAREGALRFYERAGFVTAGDRFIEEDIGPHFVMWRLVEPASPPI